MAPGKAIQHWWLGVLCICALSLPAQAAQAAPRDFRIAVKPLADALVDFAVQADVSINSGAARSCRRLGNAVSGRMEAREALRRLLANTGCTFEMVGPTAVRIVRAPPPPPVRLPASPPPRPQPDPGPTSVDEVIVTATRQPSVASRLPYAVTAVSGDTLDQQGVSDANGVALLTPGLTVTNLGPGRDKLIVRGLSDGALTGRVQSTVGLYFDDSRLTYSAPDPDLKLVDVARVEVLRGPQGSLYGAGSIGGVLHIVTREPERRAFSGRVAAEALFTSDGEPGSALEAVVNTPLFSDRAALRVVAYQDVAGGYIDDSVMGREDVNHTRRRGLRATAVLDLTESWTVSAGVISQAINSDDSQYVQAGQPDLTRANRIAEPHDNDFAAAYLSLRGDTRLGRLRWTTTVVDHRLSSRYDASTALPDFGAPLGPAAAYDEDFAVRTIVSELNLMSPLGARRPWMIGAFLSEGHEDQDSHFHAPAEIYSEVRNDEVSEVSIYGEASWPFGRWTLTVGGRYFWASVETVSAVEAPGIGTADFSGNFTESGFAPKGVIRYQATDRWMVYVQAAEGYRTGGFNTGGPIGQVFGGPGSNLQPARRYSGDELWSYEAGTKWTNPDLGLAVQAAVFMVDWAGIQSTQLLASGLPYTANIGNGRNLGAEVEAAWSVGDFDFTADLLVNHPDLDAPDPGFPANPDSALAGVARVTASVTAHYERPVGGFTFSADARYAYIGPSRLTFDAVTAPPMGDIDTTRVAVGLAGERWKVTGFVDNLIDERGNTFAYGNPFTLRDAIQITPQRPLTAGVRLDLRF